MDSNTPTGIRSVRTAFETLEFLRDSEGARVTEVADGLSVSKSTAHSHLTTLESLGYVVKINGIYQVGLQFLELGHYARARYSLYEAAKSEADQLVRATGERCQVMVVEDIQGTYIYQTTGEQAVQTASHIGSTVDLHCTAVGKSYLAHLPEDELEAYLGKVDLSARTEKTITTETELLDQLEATRKRGYATNHEESIKGMLAVGAPILTEEDEVLGAISMSIPTTRAEGPIHDSELPEQIQRSARVVAIKATYS
jgi:DNA-binding IclR family transcriptional regulator